MCIKLNKMFHVNTNWPSPQDAKDLNQFKHDCIIELKRLCGDAKQISTIGRSNKISQYFCFGDTSVTFKSITSVTASFVDETYFGEHTVVSQIPPDQSFDDYYSMDVELYSSGLIFDVNILTTDLNDLVRRQLDDLLPKTNSDVTPYDDDVSKIYYFIKAISPEVRERYATILNNPLTKVILKLDQLLDANFFNLQIYCMKFITTNSNELTTRLAFTDFTKLLYSSSVSAKFEAEEIFVSFS